MWATSASPKSARRTPEPAATTTDSCCDSPALAAGIAVAAAAAVKAALDRNCHNSTLAPVEPTVGKGARLDWLSEAGRPAPCF